jgi:hypothetical protein
MHSPSPSTVHPFRNTKSLLVVIPDDAIDVEAEARLYDDLCDVCSSVLPGAIYLTEPEPGSNFPSQAYPCKIPSTDALCLLARHLVGRSFRRESSFCPKRAYRRVVQRR